MSDLTEQEKRVKIAEACGCDEWVIVKQGYYYRTDACGYTNSLKEAWKLPKVEAKKYEMYADRADVPGCEKVTIQKAQTPDYFHDLNACAEMRKALTEKLQQYNYEACLEQIVSRDAGLNPIYGDEASEWQIINATPAQHCEAFAKSFTTPLW